MNKKIYFLLPSTLVILYFSNLFVPSIAADDFEIKVKQEIKNTSSINDTHNSVVVIPLFTSSAYAKKGFYDYYRGYCNISCLTVKIHANASSFMDSMNGVKALQSIGYNTITDIDIDKNPKILDLYDKIILLHSEYVTKREFSAITKHPHVIYLYPNSLYGKVSVDYHRNTITLIKGHGYPNSNIANGFGWKFDNSKSEYDRECKNWKFIKITNGIMLNCYPEENLGNDKLLLQAIKDY